MPALTLYLDNSVIGGYFDPEFENATRRLWTLAEAGQFHFVVSVVTQQEVVLAPPEVVQLFARTFPDDSLFLPLVHRAEELAQNYIADGILAAKFINDARHLVWCPGNSLVAVAPEMACRQGAAKEHVLCDLRLSCNAAARPFTEQPVGALELLAACRVARRLQTAAGMRPPRALHTAKSSYSSD